jgi:hypothetical protein
MIKNHHNQRTSKENQKNIKKITKKNPKQEPKETALMGHGLLTTPCGRGQYPARPRASNRISARGATWEAGEVQLLIGFRSSYFRAHTIMLAVSEKWL